MNPDPVSVHTEPPPHRRRWSAASAQAARLLVVGPRGHGKSTFARDLIRTSIVANPNIRVLLLESTPQVALDAVSELEGDLEALGLRNPGAWGKTRFTVKRDLLLRDPTLRACGWRAALANGRHDLIVVDDVEDDEAVLTLESRAATWRRFENEVCPMLVEGGRIVVVGSRKHEGDLYGRLAADPAWTLVHDRAILAWPDLSRVTYEYETVEGKDVVKAAFVPADSPGRALWPERWSVADLLKVRRSIGERVFEQEFQGTFEVRCVD